MFKIKSIKIYHYNIFTLFHSIDLGVTAEQHSANLAVFIINFKTIAPLRH